MNILGQPMALLLLLLAFDAASYANAFIVPEELPSILSLVYSNIPPIKKGTDSRLGFGFRLGDHADFQVQFEIGPQQRTRAIGTTSGNSKRNVDSDDYQQFTRKQQQNNNDGRTWIHTWSKETKKKQQFNKEKHRDALATSSEMPASPMIDKAAYNQLQQLFDMNKPKEDTQGTILAVDLDSTQSGSEVPFKPMPPETDANEVETVVSFKPLPKETMADKPADESSTRKPSRSRNNPSAVRKREKDKISVDLADVSLD
ncbi:uncharacterized protein LOC129777797 [Toxorhynchites rutilus septentrionalis]|uniref:uncharacterized protein LOC129777797 n=1 Tax=Toxorhynchites rutilus septentrionalis TaxID=329112 RepID=UPI002478FA4B|nr:uncharacterized protein LOC129777797 [Toxorhynchites rutilus septentrionalis]